jgi:hypothetical protein
VVAIRRTRFLPGARPFGGQPPQANDVVETADRERLAGAAHRHAHAVVRFDRQARNLFAPGHVPDPDEAIGLAA